MQPRRYSNEIIREIKERTDLVDLISSYVRLIRSGSNFKGLCPFHNEKTPSFSVSPDKGLWHCFGCGKGGNAFDFLMQAERISFKEAVSSLASRLGISLKDLRTGEDFSLIYDLNNEATQFYRHELVGNPKAFDYLIKDRQLEPSMIETFQIGFAPQGWRGLADHLVRKGIKEEDAIKANLLLKGDMNVFDRFRQQIIFPITNREGMIIAFAGRRFGTEEGAKYINSPDAPWFQKGNVLYALHQARRAIQDKREAIVVEGYMDVIKLHQVSVKNAVAPMGTGLTVNQARALTRLADKIILLFDGDTAGLKATLRAINLFLELNTMPWVVALPKGEDPDSLASKEPDRFLEMISSPQGWLDFLFSLSDEAYKKADAEKKLRILRRFDGIIGNVTEPTLKEILRQEVRGHYRLSMAWARELKKPRAGLVRLPEDNLLGKMYEEFLSLFAKSKEYQVIFDLIPTSYILSKKHRRIYDFLILKAYDKRNVSEWELEEDERSLLSLVQLNERVDRDGTAIYLLAVQVCMRYLEAEVMRLNKENADMERLTILQKYQQSLREYRYKIRVEDLGKVFNMLTKIRGMFPK